MAGRVWIDVLTPKQILFFSPIIEALRSAGCEVLATSRRYREVEQLAEMQELELAYVGERGGRSLADQLSAATRRQAQVIPLVKRFGPTVAVSVASGVCARVAFGLKVKHVAVNDSPHSEIAGRLSIPLSYHLLCPWVIPYEAWSRYGMPRKSITRYRALDPAAWLKRNPRRGPIPELDPGKKTIAVRIEESYAPYMAGTDAEWKDTVLERIAVSFPDANLVALCRYGNQLAEVKRKFGSRYIVPEKAVDGRSLLEKTDVLVGMGGTMSAEAALMGVPAVSTFQGSLYTERYLRSVGLLAKSRSPMTLARFVASALEARFRRRFSVRARKVLDSMEDPVPVITRQIMKAVNQA